MVGRATLTTVPSSIAMLDPSTVAASTHRPFVLVRRMAPGAGETAATTPAILSPHEQVAQQARHGGPARGAGHGTGLPPRHLDEPGP